MHFSSGRPPVSAARCAACHPGQAGSLAQAPHSLTLHLASTPDLLAEFDGLRFHDSLVNDTTDMLEVRDRKLWRRNTSFPDPILIDWHFGSGLHARTPVTVRETAHGTTELLEHNLSWYPGVGLDRTLGSTNASESPPGWHGLGKRLPPAEAADCFGCHSTWLPQHRGRLDLERIVPSVQCARCHLEGERHLAAVETGAATLQMERWSDLSPLESIRRCGECHRRDDQLPRDELRPDNLLLVRFAPVGLSQSRCFMAQAETKDVRGNSLRMDCLTYHDPHREAETDAAFYTERCVKCHGIQSGQAHLCTSQASSGQCLDCHMPKVEVQPHLRFTDHWIRTRRDGKH